MKHAKSSEKLAKKNRRKRRLKQVKILSILLLIALAGAAISIYRDYQARPGFLEKVWIEDRGADYIVVAWERARNVDKYVVTYNGKTVSVSGRRSQARIEGLKDDTEYKFSVRADSKKREGFNAIDASAKTKKFQTIEGEDHLMRFANVPVDLYQTAKTTLSYVPGSGYKINEDGNIVFTSGGEITVKVEATATEEYASASKEINVEVLDSVYVKTSGATPHTMYRLNKDNCECIMSISGTKNATTPQSFAYVNGKYYIAYIKGDVQRIISFGSKKTIYKPETDLGHSNGLTTMNGYLYLVKGGVTDCVSFDPSNKNYSELTLPYPASGIGYDPVTNMLYTSSRNRLVSYDSNLYFVNQVKRVNRTSTFYVQDCTAYGGIVMQAVSGAGYQGTNYIDFYEMANKKYLGTLECELNEVESLIVDDEGYIEVLTNTTSTTDYIWKTPINMKELCSSRVQ